jgi:hypothetical protein
MTDLSTFSGLPDDPFQQDLSTPMVNMNLPAVVQVDHSAIPQPDWGDIPPSLFAPIIFNNAYHNLYSWGTIQFVVQPLNLHEADHETSTDWAHKEIAGAAIYREWVGENDETLYVRGRVFPYRIGGFDDLQRFDMERRAGNHHPLIRGDGSFLGLYVCEKMVRSHTYLSGEGIGQQVAFEAVMVRVPMPDPASYVTAVWKATP